MVTTIDKKTSSTQVTHLDELAKDLLQVAIQQTQIKMPPMLKQEPLEVLFQNTTFLDLFKYTLAEVLSVELANKDNAVQAVYLHDPDMNPDAASGFMPVDPCLHLLCVVEKSSAGFEAFISAINHALTEEARELPSPRYEKLAEILDVMIITAKDIEKRTGYALLLTSMHAPPLNVWKK